MTMLLTERQQQLLTWIVESGSDSFTLVVVTAPGASLAALHDGQLDNVNPSDVRELADQGLLRQVTRENFELTNAGRLAYQQMIAPPPPEKHPPGFRP